MPYKDKLKAKIYRETHKEYHKAYSAKWYQLNKEKRNAQAAKYYQEHKQEHNLRNKIWRENNKERNRINGRANNLKRNHNITLEEYESWWNKQEGKCAICKQSNKRILEVDHNHKTGKIRGLLCGNCNKAIGLLDDNPKLFESGVEYLKCDMQ